MTPSRDKLIEVYRRLYERYGPQHWWPGESPFEVIIGAILTQAANWRNVEKAIKNLKVAGCFSPQGLKEVSEAELAILIRPAGCFNAKARKLKAFVDHLWQRYQGDLDKLLCQDGQSLREELLTVYGIGEETADAIALYAAEKPFFVVDAYTRRIIQRLGYVLQSQSYQTYQAFFHQNLSPDVALYNEYHALLDRHAKEICRQEPLCDPRCCLLELCPTGQSRYLKKFVTKFSNK